MKNLKKVFGIVIWTFPGIFICSGCQITAQFYVEKAFVTESMFDSKNPDLKTRAQVEVKLYDSNAPKADTKASK